MTVAIRALGHALERRHRIDVRVSRREVEVTEGAEPVAPVAALVVDRCRGEAALEPVPARALLEHPDRARDVLIEDPPRLVLVHDAADDGAARRGGASVCAT